jgi:hormone-sensitive lipase
MNVDPKKVIITGDSAGGNMGLVLSYLTIMAKIRVPDGLLLSYPALNLNREYYTPSLLYSLIDEFVPY